MKKNIRVLFSVGILAVSSSVSAINAQSVKDCQLETINEQGIVIVEGDNNDLPNEVFSRGVTTKYLYGSAANGGVDETTFRHYGPFDSRMYIVNTGDHGFEYKLTCTSGVVRRGTLNPGRHVQIDFTHVKIGPQVMIDGIGYLSIAGINGLECKATMRYNVIER